MHSEYTFPLRILMIKEGKRRPSIAAMIQNKPAILRFCPKVESVLFPWASSEESFGNITIIMGRGRKRMIFPTI
jgi:hypothetical protein